MTSPEDKPNPPKLLVLWNSSLKSSPPSNPMRKDLKPSSLNSPRLDHQTQSSPLCKLPPPSAQLPLKRSRLNSRNSEPPSNNPSLTTRPMNKLLKVNSTPSSKNSMRPENQLLKPRLTLKLDSNKLEVLSNSKKKFLRKPSLNLSLLKRARLSRNNNALIGPTSGLLTRKEELRKSKLLSKLSRSLLPSLTP